MPIVGLSLFQSHVEKWKNGCGAMICATAKNRCFAKGRLPCDVLFVGEAPGKSEDATGKIFNGPAGDLLVSIINESMARDKHGNPLWTWGATNLVMCIPYEYEDERSLEQVYGGEKRTILVGRRKASEPEEEDVMCCKPRLEEIIRIANPKLIVCVGKQADNYLAQGHKHSVKLPKSVRKKVEITHPAAILRAKAAQKSMMRRRVVVTLVQSTTFLLPDSVDG